MVDNNIKYCLSQTKINFINGENTLISFDDMDRNSMPDMHFYHEEKIYIFLNQHKSKIIETGVFKGNENLCLSPKNVTNGPIFTNSGKANESIIQDLKLLFKEHEIIGLVSQFENSIKDDPRLKLQQAGRMRTGDFNIDGYPDIFLTLKKQHKVSKKITT
jgi:hypothetical protein